MDTIYEAKIWRKGCGYIVANPGDFCNKCGHQHNQDAVEAEVGLFRKDKDENPVDAD